MADVTFSVPGMFADHHVSAVVEALNSVDGISQIVASSSRRKLTITFDSTKVSEEEMELALTAAGYPVQRVEGVIREGDLNNRGIGPSR
ncbi:MAG: heavy-metal-associated domain-containing protein [Dehalococcoidia bacterium]|nr:heavy-metal-associated domain-containing protein [Dehalococcoidia bacterium]